MARDGEARPLRAGALARQAGVSTDTLRLYERKGLLPRARRSANGYREYAPEEVRVAPNPLSRDGPAQELGDVEGNRVVFTGRMTAQKGIDHFVEIAQAADDLLGETGWEFVAFGEGFERERAAQAAGGLVRFEGGLPWAARLDAFAGARAVVVPSRAEPFGMVVLEAMEVGVPVLYPSASGVAEVIRAGKQIEPADPRSVVHALTDLLTRETEWYATAAFQLDEIERYRAAAHEDVVRQAWADALERRASRGALPESASDRAAAARTPR